MAKKKAKEPTPFTSEERRRLDQLVRKSFTGKGLTRDEQCFVEKLFKQSPEEYSVVSDAARDEERRFLREAWGLGGVVKVDKKDGDNTNPDGNDKV